MTHNINNTISYVLQINRWAHASTLEVETCKIYATTVE